MKKCAIFIDTRIQENFINVIQQHMKHLVGWPLIVCTTEPAWNKLYKKLNCDFIAIDDIKNQSDYNLLLTSPEFWQFFLALNYDRVLIFQHDSGLLKNNMDDYLPFDYLGAPWSWQDYGGNGGLSLRNPAVMYAVCVRHKYNLNEGNEDQFFSKYIHEDRCGFMAPREVCKKFSMETILEMDTTGYHAIEKHHEPTTVNMIKSQEI
jgi:hypothetical protein